MGMLVDTQREKIIALPALCLLGRSTVCAVRTDDVRVSGEHARLSWHGGQWHLRDLGSRNGTFRNGARLERGASVALAAGDTIALGDPTIAFTLLDASPPSAQARDLATQRVVHAEAGVLALPSTDDPVVTVFQDADGRWVLEAHSEVRSAADGEQVEAGDARFVLSLPEAVAPTADARSEPPDLRDVRLHFRVSRDEEHVELSVTSGGDHHVFPPRAHHYTLLLLARARQRDEATRALAEPSQGWLTVDELCRMLATDENKLNVDLFRIRRDFGALTVTRSAAIIERRRGSRQVRIGARHVVIEARV